LKKAIQYIRISQKDQSHFSIEGQKETNMRYAARHGIEIIRTYVDDGESARDFDRTNWKLLMKDLEANKKTIDYLVVMKYDRLIRNAAEGLMALEKIEVRWNIKVLSASEHISIDPHSPFFFKMRADMLVNAEFERRVISERSRFGVWRAKSEGRFIGQAPFGYRNERDENDKPIIVIDQERAQIVNSIFSDYLSGMGFRDIIRKHRAQGLTLKGHSSLKRLLTNPVYAGLIEVPDFKDDASRVVRGIHEGIIDENLFYEVSDKAKGNTKKHTSLNDEVYLRGVVKCPKCKEKMTAGNSKGRSRYYWYYRCNFCLGDNIRAEEAHTMIENIFRQLTFEPGEVETLKQIVYEKLAIKMNDSKIEARKIENAINTIIDKQNNLEEKFISDEIDKNTYKKWSDKFRRELSATQNRLDKLTLAETYAQDVLERKLDLLHNLHYVFKSAKTTDKQKLIISLFSADFELSKNFYRTTFVLPIFSSKVLNIKELDIIKNGNKIAETALTPVCTRSGN